jgi:hypothetical protein
MILDAVCAICESGDAEETMLLCDQCDSGYHTTCLELLDIPPCENWFCQQCLPNQPAGIQESQTEAEKQVKRMPVLRLRLRRPNVSLEEEIRPQRESVASRTRFSRVRLRRNNR